MKDLPAEGFLFPYLAGVRASDRATEFRSRCRQLGIKGVTLYSYRYAWADFTLDFSAVIRRQLSPMRLQTTPAFQNGLTVLASGATAD